MPNWMVGNKYQLTQSEDFFPIPATPAVIQCRVSCTGSHLPSGQGSLVDVGPLLLNGLAVRTSHTGGVIEGVPDSALWAMRGEVELWHEVRDREA